ncbi:MAG TPA: Uma2 family endonuclease [Planctomycetota bacterium]|nr:Uma2 family endonuclease [Planctomycetota bacterium]
MRAFMLEVPESLLEERRRSGADLWDEVWNGVLHMVPAPSRWHQRFGSKLFVRLEPIAEKLGFEASYETSIYRPNVGDRDYRTPDIVVYAPSNGSQRGVEGIAELAVEILSPGDETYEKLPFYVEVGVREILVVDPDSRAVELFVPEGGKPKRLPAESDGGVRSGVLGVTLTPIPGPKLRVVWPGGTIDI